jgi:hypothetical protein
MTKKKIARTKRGTKQRTGAAAKAERPIPFTPTDGPVDHEIRRAAERAGIPLIPAGDTSAIGRARAELVRGIGPTLVKACDQLSEELAAMCEVADSDVENVLGALHTLWCLRWELGMGIKGTHAHDIGVERAAGGAS